MSVSQLEQWFESLIEALQQKTVFINQGDDPVFFLVYPPRWSLQVYELLPTWEKKLRHHRWNPHVFSVGLALTDFIRDHPHRDVIVEFERDNPDEISAVNKSIEELLMTDDDHYVVEDWVATEIGKAAERENGLLILSGVELLHPYLQIGRIEQRLQGKFAVPTVVLYPGLKTSTFGLRFLGIYPPDGNYRSRHVGGTTS